MIGRNIELGFGYIVSAQGVPGPASDITYTNTYVFPEGIYENRDNQKPYMDRWDGVDVVPLSPNTCFPVMRLDGNLIPSMPRELPVANACSGPSPLVRGGPSFFDLDAFIAAVAVATPEQRAWIRKVLP